MLTIGAGCNELIFNPLIQWWRKGPITKQLRIFMWSSAPVHYKIGMLSCKLHYCTRVGDPLTEPPRHVLLLYVGLERPNR